MSTGRLPSGVRAPEPEISAWLRRVGATAWEGYQLGRSAAERECHCSLRRGAGARDADTGPEIVRGYEGAIMRVY